MNKKNIVVFGLDNFGMSTIKELSKYNCDTLAIDKNLDRVEIATEYATCSMQINVQETEDFKELSLNSYDIAIITFSKIESSILASLVCKENDIPMVIVKASNEIHKKILEKMDIDKIIFPEKEMGIKLVKSLMGKNFAEIIDLSDEYSIVEIITLEKWIGETISGLKLRNIYGLNVLCIKNKSKEIIISPTSDYILSRGDVLIGIAFNEKFNKKYYGEK